ncbi:hypothetical protein T459_30001 [Capsicum annuum]|uniref:Uncharacterized protein n=1 Tax=Capsicum annuum TaxID=4072 RepID=A0A2G2Y740_CAPAN|nr:hypothetical protein T459_30001 [Capsicum annuum]
MASPTTTVGISLDPIDDLPLGNNANRFDANVIMVLAVLDSTLAVSFAYPNLELERKLRHCLIDTCKKIANGDNSVTTNSISSAAVQEIVVRIEPLKRDGVIST